MTLANSQFTLPDDGRQKEHVCEKRRLLFSYLRDGPKNLFKSRLTMVRELTALWPDLGWSVRTLARLLADLARLGLLLNGTLRGFHGTRNRRIKTDALREDGPRVKSNALRNQRKKRVCKSEDGPPVTKAVAEDGPPAGAKMAHRGFILDSYSCKSEGFSKSSSSGTADDDLVSASELPNEKPNRFEILQDRAKNILTEKGEDPEMVDAAIAVIDQRSKVPPSGPAYYVTAFENVKATAEWNEIFDLVQARKVRRQRFMLAFSPELTPEQEKRRQEFNEMHATEHTGGLSGRQTRS